MSQCKMFADIFYRDKIHLVYVHFTEVPQSLFQFEWDRADYLQLLYI